MLNTEEMNGLAEELAEELRSLAGELEAMNAHNEALAEKVLDFERGLVTLPELTKVAREILTEAGYA